MIFWTHDHSFPVAPEAFEFQLSLAVPIVDLAVPEPEAVRGGVVPASLGIFEPHFGAADQRAVDFVVVGPASPVAVLGKRGGDDGSVEDSEESEQNSEPKQALHLYCIKIL